MAIAGKGFPAFTRRHDLTDAGVRLVDERFVADPRKELSAKTMELLLWQAGALGAVGPMVTLVYEPAPYAGSEKVRFGALAWDPSTLHLSEAPSWSWVTITRNGAGDYSFRFPKTVAASDGTLQPVCFRGGVAQPSGLDGTPLGGNLFAEVEIVGLREARVRVRDSSNVLTEAPVTFMLFGGPLTTPLDLLDNVALWARPDSGFVTAGGSVVNRGSLGGFMTAASAGTLVAADASFGNKPSILLASTAQYYTLPNLSSLAQGEMFLVGKKIADPASSDVASGGWNLGSDAGSATHFPFTDGNIYDAFGTSARKTVGNPSPSMTSAFVYNPSSAPSAWSARFNGAEIFTTGTNVVGFPAAPTFGRTVGAPDRYYDGYWAELIVCGSVQSALARARYAAYHADWFT